MFYRPSLASVLSTRRVRSFYFRSRVYRTYLSRPSMPRLIPCACKSSFGRFYKPGLYVNRSWNVNSIILFIPRRSR